MFRKLRNKFLILNMTVTSLVMITAFAAIYLTTYNNIKTENQKRLNNLADSLIIRETVMNPTHSDSQEQHTVTNNQREDFSYNIQGQGFGINRITSDSSPSFVVTTDNNGNISAISSSVEMPDEFYTQAAELAWYKYNKNDNTAVNISERQWLYNISPVQIIYVEGGQQPRIEVSGNQFHVAFFEITDSLKTLRDLLFTIIFVSAGLLAVIFAISFVFANRSIKPISESWEKQKKFISDASHELKTPLSTIMANYDVLTANEDETIKSQREWLDYIKIGMDRMNRLVSNLLVLARSENINIQAQKLPFHIDNLVCEIIQSMTAAAQAKNLQINKRVEFTGNISGYEDQVRQILTIIYDNAVKYANANGKIDVIIKRVKKSCACSVKNTGAGISSKDLPYIFDRFYRANTARSSEDNSYGLGLSIAKSISDQIGGKITANSVENEWTEFIFTFDL